MSSRTIENSNFSFKTISSPSGVPALSFAPDGGVVVRNPNSTADNSVATNQYVQQVVAQATNVGMSPNNSYEWTSPNGYQVFNANQTVSIGDNLSVPPTTYTAGDTADANQFGLQFDNGNKGKGETDFINISGNRFGGFSFQNVGNTNSYSTMATLLYDNAQNVTMNLTGISAEYQINGNNILVPHPASQSEANTFTGANSFSGVSTFTGDVSLQGDTEVVGNMTFNAGTLNLANASVPTATGLVQLQSDGTIGIQTNQAQKGVTLKSGANTTTFYADSSSRLNLGFNGLYTTGNMFSNNYTSTGAINAVNMTITGSATAPTAPKNTNTTQLATCAFVLANQSTLTDIAQLNATNIFTATNTFEAPTGTSPNLQLTRQGQLDQATFSFKGGDLTIGLGNINNRFNFTDGTNTSYLTVTSTGMSLNGSPILTSSTTGNTVTTNGSNLFTGQNTFSTETNTFRFTDSSTLTNLTLLQQTGPYLKMTTAGGSSGLTLANATGTTTLYNITATGLASSGDLYAPNFKTSGALVSNKTVQSLDPQLTILNSSISPNAELQFLTGSSADGNYNNLVHQGDSLIWFDNGTQNTGGLVIGGGTSNNFGMRMDNSAQSIAIYGTTTLNGSAITTQASLGSTLNGYAQLASANFASLSVGGQSVATINYGNTNYAQLLGANFTGKVNLNGYASCPTNTYSNIIANPTTNTVNEVTMNNYVDYRLSSANSQYFTGQIISGMMNATATSPYFLLCNGQSVSRAKYPSLFAVIADNYGSVDGASFNVPDLRGSFPIGGTTTTGVTPVPSYVNSLDFRDPQTYNGKTGGSTYISKAPSHTHDYNDDGHVHGYGEGFIDVANGTGGGKAVKVPNITTGYYSTDASLTGITIYNNVSAPYIGIIPPYLAVNYFIYVGYIVQ